MPPIALVTGADGGLGRAIGRRLLQAGMWVAAVDLEFRSDLPESRAVLALRADVTDPGAVDAMLEAVHAKWGAVQVLINNAGIPGPSASVAEYPLDAWRRVLEVDLTGTFICLRACLPDMIPAGYGRVVNVASIAGAEGNPNMSAYAAAKAGVIALTKSAGKEYARTGVLINCVVPAVFDEGFTHRVSDEERDLFESRVPMGRMGKPEEFAEMVAWLASERCSFSTGATFDLSGGRAVY